MTTPTARATAATPDAALPLESGRQPSADDGPASADVWHGLVGLVRPPERGATIGVLIVALVASATCWYFGADAWHSILMGIAITTAGVSASIGLARLDHANIAWRDSGLASRKGARNDIAELSFSLRGSHGLVDHRAVWRVQRLARQRLALQRLDLLDPADRHEIEQLIGRSAYAVLVTSKRRPMLRSLLHCLDALDMLEPGRLATPSRSRRRMPIFALHRSRRSL